MKKLLALLLALMMVLSLAACGGGDDTPSGNKDNPGVSQSDNQGGNNDGGGDEQNNGGEDEAPDEGGDDKFTEFGLSEAGILPEGVSEYEVTDGDSNLHEIEFAVPDGFVKEDYFYSLFELTASISDNGNCKDAAHGASPEPELEGTTFDEVMEEVLGSWYYQIDGVTYRIRVAAEDYIGAPKCRITLNRY